MQKIADMFDQVARWIVLSSSDPRQVSLTVKAGLLFLVPYFIGAMGLAHVQLGSDALNGIVDGIVLVVQVSLMLIAAVMGLYGSVRKAWLTISGQNSVNR